MRSPDHKEVSFFGRWIEQNGKMEQDSVCERIQWLTNSYFQEIKVNADSWSALYKNPDDGSYWELTYPMSHMHGGGPPSLTRISKELAERRYKLMD